MDLLVAMLEPTSGRIYDPACGTGGMLIEAIHHINNDRLTYGRIYGQEKNLSTSAIARMNLFLHGAKDFKVVQGDTLRDPKFLSGGKVKRFDCVIANPPFGLDGWGASQFENDAFGRNIWGTPSDSSADWAWIQHMVSSMKDKTGRCAVIMPQGVLFHGGKEGQMRQQLIDLDLIECVITLVGGVFFAAGVNACIILLNKNKVKAHKDKIWLIDASKIYTAKRAQKIMTPENIDEVFKLYQNYENVVDKCQIISRFDVQDTLMPKNYIQKSSTEIINPTEVKKQYLLAYEKMVENEKRMKKLIVEGGYINE